MTQNEQHPQHPQHPFSFFQVNIYSTCTKAYKVDVDKNAFIWKNYFIDLILQGSNSINCIEYSDVNQRHEKCYFVNQQNVHSVLGQFNFQKIAGRYPQKQHNCVWINVYFYHFRQFCEKNEQQRFSFSRFQGDLKIPAVMTSHGPREALYP